LLKDQLASAALYWEMTTLPDTPNYGSYVHYPFYSVLAYKVKKQIHKKQT